MTRALILAALLATSAQAQPVPNTDKPPKAYQGDAEMHVVTLPPDRLAQVCGDARDAGCYWPDRKTIYIWNPCTMPDGGYYGRLMCHEQGHVNGWPGSDGR